MREKRIKWALKGSMIALMNVNIQSKSELVISLSYDASIHKLY